MDADSVLLQGAQVSSDSVCGGAGNPFIDDKALSTSIMDNGELPGYYLLVNLGDQEKLTRGLPCHHSRRRCHLRRPNPCRQPDVRPRQQRAQRRK